MKFLKLDFEDIYKICLKLSDEIKKNNENFDVIIGISRGGIIPARILADMLGVKEIYIISSKYYKGIEKRIRKPLVEVNFNLKKLKNKNILIVDDVADTGITLSTIIKETNLKAKTLTLYKKPRSKFEPDYYYDITTEWIVFPWEIFETKKLINKP